MLDEPVNADIRQSRRLVAPVCDILLVSAVDRKVYLGQTLGHLDDQVYASPFIKVTEIADRDPIGRSERCRFGPGFGAVMRDDDVHAISSGAVSLQ